MRLFFAETPVRRAAKIMSLVGIATAAVLIFFPRRRGRTVDSKAPVSSVERDTDGES